MPLNHLIAMPIPLQFPFVMLSMQSAIEAILKLIADLLPIISHLVWAGSLILASFVFWKRQTVLTGSISEQGTQVEQPIDKADHQDDDTDSHVSAEEEHPSPLSGLSGPFDASAQATLSGLSDDVLSPTIDTPSSADCPTRMSSTGSCCPSALTISSPHQTTSRHCQEEISDSLLISGFEELDLEMMVQFLLEEVVKAEQRDPVAELAESLAEISRSGTEPKELLSWIDQTTKALTKSDAPVVSDVISILQSASRFPECQELHELITAADCALLKIPGNFTAPEFVAAISCIAKLGRKGSEWLEAVSRGGMHSELIHSFTAEQCVSVLSFLSQIYTSKQEGTAARSAGCRNLVFAISKKINKICAESDPFGPYRSLSTEGEYLPVTTCGPFEPSQFVSLLQAYSHLEISVPETLSLVCNQLADAVADCYPALISNMVYALGRLKPNRSITMNLFTAVCINATTRLPAFKPQELANIVYAFGQLQFFDEAFLVALADHIPGRAKSFKPQELSITAYAYSQLGMTHAKLLTSIAEQISSRFASCSAQAVSNTIYAFARLDFRHSALMKTCAEGLPARLDELAPQHISNIMFAYGKLGVRNEELLAAVCDHVPRRLYEFRPQNIANTIYATWKLGYRHDRLLKAVADHLPGRFHECVPQDISNVIYAMGELGYKNPQFFDKAGSFVFSPKGLGSRMSPKDKSFLLSAFRRAGVEVPEEWSAAKGVGRPRF